MYNFKSMLYNRNEKFQLYIEYVRTISGYLIINYVLRNWQKLLINAVKNYKSVIIFLFIVFIK
jgi:hypothetical protein